MPAPPKDQPRPAPPGRLAYSIPEAAFLLGCSTTKVWRMIAAGDLATFKVGTATRITRVEIDRYIAEAVERAS